MIRMERNSVKESILSYLSDFNPLMEKGPTGPDGNSKETQLKSEEPSAPKQVNDPDKNAANPEVEDLAGYSEYQSLLFLVSRNENGIISKGENIGWIEIDKKTIEEDGLPVDLEDFQWWCPAPEFEKYLDQTGRSYNQDSGEWTSESEEELSKKRKINSYSDFLNEKEKYEPINEIGGIPFIGNIGPSTTSKGMSWSGEEPEFQKGKLSNTQRKYVKFFFTRNRLKKENIIKNELNLNDLKPGEKYEIFISPYDPGTKEAYSDTSVIGIRYRVDSVIPKSGDLKSIVVIGVAERISPDIGVDKKGGGLKGVLEEAVSHIAKLGNLYNQVWNSTTGKLFVGGIVATSIAEYVVPAISTIGSAFFLFRANKALGALAGLGKTARTAKTAKKLHIWKRAFSFIKYPFTAPFTVGRRALKLSKASSRARSVFKGWKAAKYIAFGTRIAKGSKVARAGSAIARGTNPVGWVLLAADAVGSFFNYTSDNQAPSWDPIVGGEGDSMIKYTGEGGLCPNASNVFNPEKIKTGETITLCWTQNPTSGFALALSFVVSNSTRTTMNITKITDWDNRKISMFFINSVNYDKLWNEIKGFDLRFLFIAHGEYSEGFADDNIGAYFLGGKASEDQENLLPLAYDGHCSADEFESYYKDSPDQLVVIDKDFPKEYNFHFEDKESNVINVYGRLITDKDLETADEKEIESYFDVQPVSSLIGNPDTDTDEERAERNSIEKSGSSDLPDDEEDSNEPSTGEDERKNESEEIKWYSKINESQIISNFNEFKSLKEISILESDKEKSIGSYVDDTITDVKNLFGSGEEEKKELPKPKTSEEGKEKEEKSNTIRKIVNDDLVSTTSELDENFTKILNSITGPIPYGIYFVDLREYADPKLRRVYKPGSFMNFNIDKKAINVSDGQSIEGLLQVNNLDILLDVKKGIYSYKEGEEKEIKGRESEKGEKVETSNTIRTSYLGKEKEDIGKIEPIESKEILKTFDRVEPSILSDLGISQWEDVTNIRVITDDDKNIKEIKIKNKKANFGDRSRSIKVGDSNFESAKKLSDAYEDKLTEESEEKNKDKNR